MLDMQIMSLAQKVNQHFIIFMFTLKLLSVPLKNLLNTMYNGNFIFKHAKCIFHRN